MLHFDFILQPLVLCLHLTNEYLMETLQTPYGNFNVYLNPLYSAQGNYFHISFVDKKNKLHVILMQEKWGVWLITDPGKQPDWILALSSQLDKLIIKEQLKTYKPVAMAG